MYFLYGVSWVISQYFYQIYFSKNQILVGRAGREERYTNEINELIYLIGYTFSYIGVVLWARKAVHFQVALLISDGDGHIEIAVGFSDRILRTYRWYEHSDGKSGEIVALNKWSLNAQVGKQFDFLQFKIPKLLRVSKLIISVFGDCHYPNKLFMRFKIFW